MSANNNPGSGTGLAPTPVILWQLALVLWLGSHLASLFLFMPLLQRAGLAPLLQAEVLTQLRPALLLTTLMAVVVQMLALLRSGGWQALWTELRGWLVLGVALLALLLLLLSPRMGMDWLPLRGLYGAMLGCGLLLLAMPLDGARRH